LKNAKFITFSFVILLVIPVTVVAYAWLTPISLDPNMQGYRGPMEEI